MRIAIASGKGGTGKTTVATNLAHVASGNGRRVAYIDCDVEEPNGHIFLKPDITDREPIDMAHPRVDEEKCTSCGQCGEICQYSAIVCIGQKVLLYPELCHACGGCWLVCPDKAITEVPRTIGQLEKGRSAKIASVQGTLNIGEAKAPPAIKAVRQAIPEGHLAIIDAPPGTSCPVIEAIRDSDFVVLVTEPTPFGLNDLELAVDMIRALGLPFGVVINRSGIGDDRVQDFCLKTGIPILVEIPDDRCIAEAYSRGQMVVEVLPEKAAIFERLLARIEETVSHRAED